MPIKYIESWERRIWNVNLKKSDLKSWISTRPYFRDESWEYRIWWTNPEKTGFGQPILRRPVLTRQSWLLRSQSWDALTPGGFGRCEIFLSLLKKKKIIIIILDIPGEGKGKAHFWRHFLCYILVVYYSYSVLAWVLVSTGSTYWVWVLLCSGQLTITRVIIHIKSEYYIMGATHEYEYAWSMTIHDVNTADLSLFIFATRVLSVVTTRTGGG